LDAECVQAAEEAMHVAAKYTTRCEALAALQEFASTMIDEQARVAEAERARVAAEAAVEAVEAAAEEAAAVERLQLQEMEARLTLQLQQVRVQLRAGVVAQAAPPSQPQAEEAVYVVCMGAPKQYIILPCGHQCVCEACAQQLTQTTSSVCPVCRAFIQQTTRNTCGLLNPV
jgi:hypothetical protein